MSGKIIWLAMLVTLVYWLGSIGGCATSGSNQNYRILEEDTPMFDTDPDADTPGAAMVPAAEDEADRVADAFRPDEGLAGSAGAEGEQPVGPSATEAEVATDSEPTAVEPMSRPAPATDTVAAEPTSQPGVPSDAADVDPVSQPGVPNDAVAVELMSEPVADDPLPAEPVIETEPSLRGLDRSHWVHVTVTAESGDTPVQPHYFEDLPLAATRGGPEGEQPPDICFAAGWDRPNAQAVVRQPLKFMLDLVLLPVHILRDPPHNLQARSPLDRLAARPAFRSASDSPEEPAEVVDTVAQ